MPIEIEMQILPEKDVTNTKTTNIVKSPEKVLNNSTTSEDSYTTIKDKILKKRNLDLSPQFVYSKSILMQKQHEVKITSKFFESDNNVGLYNNKNKHNDKNLKKEEILKCDENLNLGENEICSMTKNNVVVSSPKGEIKNLEVPVAGFLFNHGPQVIPDSLNQSISTTGFEDSEDFPQCIDSSLLLSPKVDIPSSVPSTHNNEVLSQEVPNFLSGFRKIGLSFFGNTSSSNNNAGCDTQPQSGSFNFAFGNEEKKGRGGFFSMFH